jgi:hypothetical protein
VTLNNLTEIVSLILADNKFKSGPVPDLSQLKSMQELSLALTQRNGNIPDYLGSIPTLLYLDLHGNDISGEIPYSLGDAESLAFLLLNANKLTGYIHHTLGQLSNLSKWKGGRLQCAHVFSLTIFWLAPSHFLVELLYLDENELEPNMDGICGSGSVASPDWLVVDCSMGCSVDTCCSSCCDVEDADNTCNTLQLTAHIDSQYVRQVYEFDDDISYSIEDITTFDGGSGDDEVPDGDGAYDYTASDDGTSDDGANDDGTNDDGNVSYSDDAN